MRPKYDRARAELNAGICGSGTRLDLFECIHSISSEYLEKEEALLFSVEYLNELLLGFEQTKEIPIFNDFKRICKDLCTNRVQFSYGLEDIEQVIQLGLNEGSKDKFFNDIGRLLEDLFGKDKVLAYTPYVKKCVSSRNHSLILNSKDNHLRYFYILLISLAKQVRRYRDIASSSCNHSGIDYLSMLYQGDFNKDLLFCLGPESLGRLIDVFGGREVYVPSREEVDGIKLQVKDDLKSSTAMMDKLIGVLERNIDSLSTRQLDRLEHLIAKC